MAVTGLLLIGFLVTHLSGNLLVFAGAETFNHYSQTLVSNPLIVVAELALLALFVAHLANGIVLTRKNRAARPQPYVENQPAGHTSRKSLASTTMIVSGLIVLVFVPLHVWTFKYGPHYDSAAHPGVRDLHRLVLEVFGNPGWVLWYVAAMIVIGFHLWHGFASGFESMGLSYRRGLRSFGKLLALVLAAGFTLIPVLVYMMGDKL